MLNLKKLIRFRVWKGKIREDSYKKGIEYSDPF
jgi:hypothetical protein